MRTWAHKELQTQAFAGQSRLLEHFVPGRTARMAAQLVGIYRNTARTFYHRLRQIIALQSDEVLPFAGPIEVDKSYFGGRRKGNPDPKLLWLVKNVQNT